MAGWISSKLKVAESLLQQIDQQAAESLRKGEHRQSEFVNAEEKEEGTSFIKADSIPVKLQIPRKPLERVRSQDPENRPERVLNSSERNAEASARVSEDGDWTELLNSSGSIGASTSSRGAIRQGSFNRKSSGKIGRENEPRRRVIPDRTADSSTNRKISQAEVAEVQSPEKWLGEISNSSPETARDESKNVDSLISVEDKTGVDLVTDLKENTSGIPENVQELPIKSKIAAEIRVSTESDSESSSSSDSEYEREREERRKRREKVLAEKAAALAAEAIKERENLVARLEGERESLQKMVEERQKQQAQEASQLQSTMMETMEAVELEKQKHKSTRMEAFALLAELEIKNFELSRILASTQWDLQVEVDRVLDLREMIQTKELAQEEIKRRMSDIHLNSSSDHKDKKRSEYERKVLEAEYHFICDKISQMKEKVRTLERNIQTTKELAFPTEDEIKLKKRLEQLTDHLIHKQAQVENLSSEKATLQFRIETLSRLIVGEENGGERNQGFIIPTTAAPARVVVIDDGGPVAAAAAVGETKVGSILLQLDSIFSAGLVFLRKNTIAKIGSWVYLLCLHLWVWYILTSTS